MADVDIEHYGVAVVMLSFDEIIEVRANRIQRFRQRLALFDGINRQIKRRNTSVAEPIDYIRFHQTAVSRQIYEDVSLGAVVNDPVNELWTQKRFATHQGHNDRA